MSSTDNNWLKLSQVWIRTQSHPFTISIHGYWGTGKTFLLQRWQRDLETDGFKAIYFNAWEDDFCDDPLLAILGQLAEYFQDPRLKSLASAAIEIAKPLLRQTVLSLVKTTTGLTLDFSQSHPPTLMDEYLGQRRTKDELKAHLATLGVERCIRRNRAPTGVHHRRTRPMPAHIRHRAARKSQAYIRHPKHGLRLRGQPQRSLVCRFARSMAISTQASIYAAFLMSHLHCQRSMERPIAKRLCRNSVCKIYSCPLALSPTAPCTLTTITRFRKVSPSCGLDWIFLSVISRPVLHHSL